MSTTSASPQRNTKVEIPTMIQDPLHPGERLTDHFQCTLEREYFDGPVSDRVAILDFDHQTGKLRPGVGYIEPSGGRVMGRFDVPRDPAFPRKKVYLADKSELMLASVFGTVLRTIKLFEHKNVLGHRVRWSFDGPQLLVIPRAGEWANAFYHRDSRSLQLFFCRPDPAGEFVYTALSRDIVAHETAHAILDGIAPDLYDALTPEALAIHETVADLTAVMMAAESQKLVTDVLFASRGAIEDSTALSGIAAQFGAALDSTGKAKYLRQLVNDKTLVDVAKDEPHELSEVFSGALFAVLRKMHEQHREKLVQEERWQSFEDPWYSCSGAAFTAACFRLRNTIFQALEYLPPGEISFADYGRAILAVDQGGNLNPPHVRTWVIEELVERGIVDNTAVLDVETNYSHRALKGLHLDELITDDTRAQCFADENRELLRAPPDAELTVRRRQVLEKNYYDVDRNVVFARECLFKVAWTQLESNELVPAIAEPRAIVWGTTLVIDLIHRKVRAVLTSDRGAYQRKQRDRMFKRLFENGLLARDGNALAPDGTQLDSVIALDTTGGQLRIRGSGHLLHIAE